MFSIKITTLALVALFGATSLAAAVSVEFKGKTIIYNPAALNASREDTEGAVTAKRDENDVCGDSSYVGTKGPWPVESDCATLGDYVSRQYTKWDVWANTPDYHGIIGAGTCVFGAGTKNVFGAEIGSSDISVIISESIKSYANDAMVGAAGEMGCESDFGDTAKVFWKLQKK